MIKISKIIETMDLLDENKFFKESDVIFNTLIKVASDHDEIDYSSFGAWNEDIEEGTEEEYLSARSPEGIKRDIALELDNFESQKESLREEMLELQKKIARDDLMALTSKPKRTLEDIEEISKIIAFLSEEEYTPDERNTEFQRILGDPSEYENIF